MRATLSPRSSIMRPLLISCIFTEGCSFANSCFITSGKGLPNDPKPVVDEDPNATILRAPPALSLAWVSASGAPRESPCLNARQAAAGLDGRSRSCASVGGLKTDCSSTSRSKQGRPNALDIKLTDPTAVNLLDRIAALRAGRVTCTFARGKERVRFAPRVRLAAANEEHSADTQGKGGRR